MFNNLFGGSNLVWLIIIFLLLTDNKKHKKHGRVRNIEESETME